MARLSFWIALLAILAALGVALWRNLQIAAVTALLLLVLILFAKPLVDFLKAYKEISIGKAGIVFRRTCGPDSRSQMLEGAVTWRGKT